jgi:RHS repeat-associated protein
MSVRRRASGRVHYNYFRDYDSAIGRYAESDPIGIGGGTNTYAYVRARPLKRVDPFGLCDYCDTNTSQRHEDSMEKVARRMIAMYQTASIVNGVEYCAFICQEPNLKTFFSMPAQQAPIEGMSGTCQPMLLQKCPECSIQRGLWHTHYGDAYGDGETLSDGDIDVAASLRTGQMNALGQVGAVTAQGINVYAGTPSRQIWEARGRNGSQHRLRPLRPGEGVIRTNR